MWNKLSLQTEQLIGQSDNAAGCSVLVLLYSDSIV